MPDEGRVSVSRGNPDLKPRLSDNLDASLEYHFDNGGSRVSVAAFHKNVKDMIYTQTQIVDGFVLDGETLAAEISSPLNASDASVEWRPDVNKLLSVE